MWATVEETEARWLAETCERAPADPGDVRFEVGTFEEGMEETPYWLDMIDDTGAIVERHAFVSAWERSNLIVAFRESQSRREEAERLGVHPLEIEFAPFGPAWQREMEERGRYAW